MGVKDIRINDYPYIVKWGQMMGSSTGYIERLVRQARSDNAPQTAIYPRTVDGENEWATIEDVENPKVFKEMGIEVPEHLLHGVTITLSKTFSTTEAREAFENDVRQRLSGIEGIRSRYVDYE